MPTPAIFDFDSEKLSDWAAGRADDLLAQQPALYVNHLAIAQHLTAWAGDLEEHVGVSPGFEDRNKGFGDALRDLAAHLRQGDYLDGGILLRNS